MLEVGLTSGCQLNVAEIAKSIERVSFRIVPIGLEYFLSNGTRGSMYVLVKARERCKYSERGAI